VEPAGEKKTRSKKIKTWRRIVDEERRTGG